MVLGPAACHGTAEDSSQYLILGRARAKAPFTYYAGAGWTRAGDFASQAEWNGYLETFARRLGAPLKITLEAGARP